MPNTAAAAAFNQFAVFADESSTDTDGTDGSDGDDGIQQHFLDVYTQMCVAAGEAVSAALLNAFAKEAADCLSGFDAFLDDVGGLAVTRPKLPSRETKLRLTVIDGGKRD